MPPNQFKLLSHTADRPGWSRRVLAAATLLAVTSLAVALVPIAPPVVRAETAGDARSMQQRQQAAPPRQVLTGGRLGRREAEDDSSFQRVASMQPLQIWAWLGVMLAMAIGGLATRGLSQIQRAPDA